MTVASLSPAPAASPASTFAPLRRRAFAVLWTATLIGNIGLWMRDTASGWLMTELAPSPLMVAAVQAAATLPVFLLSLPAGALADIVDRRRMMIVLQLALAAVTVCLAALTGLGLIGPVSLLLLTLAAGTGAALSGPVWSSIVPELVPREELRPAVALNSLGINIGRAIGPALAAAVIVSAGVAAAYIADALTYVVTLSALIWWRRTQARPTTPEHFGGAMAAGVRFTLASRPLQRVLVRAVLFFAPASCYWALLPLVSRNEIGGGAAAYGVLLGAIGAGAVAGALLMPRLRQRLGSEALAFAAALLTAVATLALALAASLAVGGALLALAGAAWITVLTTLNATAQGVLPGWVRGRGVAVYLTVFFGTMTAGSLLWGQLASLTSLDTALVVAGGVGVLAALASRRLPLPSGEDDLAPSHAWPEPMVATRVDPASGPIMVTVAYQVRAADQLAFAEAALQLRALRRRDGAYRWGLMADAAHPETILEWFLVGSWEEHLRQHERLAVADGAVQDRVRSFHRGPEPPRVSHLIPVGSATPSFARDHVAGTERPDVGSSP